MVIWVWQSANGYVSNIILPTNWRLVQYCNSNLALRQKRLALLSAIRAVLENKWMNIYQTSCLCGRFIQTELNEQKICSFLKLVFGDHIVELLSCVCKRLFWIVAAITPPLSKLCRPTAKTSESGKIVLQPMSTLSFFWCFVHHPLISSSCACLQYNCTVPLVFVLYLCQWDVTSYSPCINTLQSFLRFRVHTQKHLTMHI